VPKHKTQLLVADVS